MSKSSIGLLVALLMLVSGARAADELPAPAHYIITAAVSAIRVDGILDEPAWQKATTIKLPFEEMPGDNTPAPVDTDCLLTFDGSHLYAAFRCFDPEPHKLRAHLMDRDAIDTFVQDDHVFIVLDAFNDERRGFQFRVNPLGVQADANFSELEGYEDFSWDAIWASAGTIADWGYAVEMAIPFNQLRFARTDRPQTWGFSAGRSWPRNVRHRMLSHPRDRNRACLLCQYNKISGFQGISPGRNVEFDPTLTVNRTDAMDMDSFPSGAVPAGKVAAEPGISAKWGITPNLILNGTANPDFSQVEADVAQLEVNTRFALYYPEKRPFFLEGADFFLTPVEAVFTRTMADPVWGMKLTGKSGRSAFGFFGTEDRINNLIFPSNQGSMATSTDDNVLGGVFRYRYDVGQGSTLGLLYTGRVGKGYGNHVAGADGFFRLGRRDSFRFQLLGSQTEYPGEIARDFDQKHGGFGGLTLQAMYAHEARDWQVYMSYSDLSSGFRADCGFVPRVDVRTFDGEVWRIFWGNGKKWFDRLMFWVRGYHTSDHSGRMTDSRIALGGAFIGPWQSQVQAVGRLNREFYNGVTYDVSDAAFVLRIKPAGGWNLGFDSNLGKAIDYNNSRPAVALGFGPFIELGLGRHINLNCSHLVERLASGGLRTYTANLTQVRLIYNFSTRAFIRAILQYQDLDCVPERYTYPVDARTKQVFSQWLFSYKINPQTVLFLGYSDNSLGLRGIAITRTDRTFFIKIGYAFGL